MVSLRVLLLACAVALMFGSKGAQAQTCDMNYDSMSCQMAPGCVWLSSNGGQCVSGTVCANNVADSACTAAVMSPDNNFHGCRWAYSQASPTCIEGGCSQSTTASSCAAVPDCDWDGSNCQNWLPPSCPSADQTTCTTSLATSCQWSTASGCQYQCTASELQAADLCAGYSYCHWDGVSACLAGAPALSSSASAAAPASASSGFCATVAQNAQV